MKADAECMLGKGRISYLHGCPKIATEEQHNVITLGDLTWSLRQANIREIKNNEMGFLPGSSDNSWKPAMPGGPTTAIGYWFNWRVLLCAIWVLASSCFALMLVRKYEAFCSRSSGNGGRETNRDAPGVLYNDETWTPCLKGIHPAWLLAFRVIAFFLLLGMSCVTALVDGASIYYYYTQWTSTLVSIYFGVGSLLSAYGCYRYGHKFDSAEIDSEKANFADPRLRNSSGMTSTNKSCAPPSQAVRETAGIFGYAFQIIFQMNAGAVVLTDSVFWFIIVPFLAVNNYRLRFLDINMHTINVVLLLGDTALNCLRFPLFRIAYFFLWTTIYVIFQWVVHACFTIWWPYPFLDLSSPYAPLWYFSVALMHFPCYGFFALVVKLKHCLLARWFPQSYQGLR
ncbi:uncharacterized protein LOC115734814 isoform X1 [Rhodamnia argentea]|uniref:Uncharacterized protein LOC115734814 isoform X1 n=3 Tax=Rhodamnia argentea TaxID=178133 RepID=A0A8B8NGL4_9MYRT|nr:uncharacterized protein LOC115734814 isoform X1 [Rhodamnia argentea]